MPRPIIRLGLGLVLLALAGCGGSGVKRQVQAEGITCGLENVLEICDTRPLTANTQVEVLSAQHGLCRDEVIELRQLIDLCAREIRAANTDE